MNDGLPHFAHLLRHQPFLGKLEICLKCPQTTDNYYFLPNDCHFANVQEATASKGLPRSLEVLEIQERTDPITGCCQIYEPIDYFMFDSTKRPEIHFSLRHIILCIFQCFRRKKD